MSLLRGLSAGRAEVLPGTLHVYNGNIFQGFGGLELPWCTWKPLHYSEISMKALIGRVVPMILGTVFADVSASAFDPLALQLDDLQRCVATPQTHDQD